MKNIAKSIFVLLNRIVISAIAIVAFVVLQIVALLNYIVFSASTLAIIIYLSVSILYGNWLYSFSHIFGIGINTQTWQIVSIHGWFYSFLLGAVVMRYFPLVGMSKPIKPFDSARPKQRSETKYVFVSPPEVG